jgi:hypothetical protein
VKARCLGSSFLIAAIFRDQKMPSVSSFGAPGSFIRSNPSRLGDMANLGATTAHQAK